MLDDSLTPPLDRNTIANNHNGLVHTFMDGRKVVSYDILGVIPQE